MQAKLSELEHQSGKIIDEIQESERQINVAKFEIQNKKKVLKLINDQIEYIKVQYPDLKTEENSVGYQKTPGQDNVNQI